jgi:hypothetical protein
MKIIHYQCRFGENERYIRIIKLII